MKTKQVYLAKQSQLDTILANWQITAVVLQRIEKKEWIPFFDIRNDQQAITCAIRLKTTTEARTWSDVNALIEWLDNHMGVKECKVSLSDYEWQSELLTSEEA